MFFISRIPVRRAVGKRCSSNLYSVEQVLSPKNRELCMDRFKALRPIRMQPHKPVKRAAILIPLCVVGSRVSLLYTLRAADLRTHRGQVSFPGGMQDVNDNTLEQTALRETEEELGIPKSEIDLWGTGSYIETRGPVSVQPVVGYWTRKSINLDRLRTNRTEVEDVFAVSLEDLCNPTKIGYTQFRDAYSVPVFLGGKRRIWGLTALITNMFLKCLLPLKAYSHSIRYVPTIKDPSTKTNATIQKYISS